MSYKYQFNFSGLISFVPYVELNKPRDQAKKKMKVLVIDGKNRNCGPDKEALFSHVSFLYYYLEDLADESRRRPDLISKEYGLTFLSLEDLIIGQQNPCNPNLSFDLTDDNKEPEPGKYCSPSDLCWVMPIHRVGDVYGTTLDLNIKDKYLVEEYKVESSCGLNARFELTQGKLYTRDFQRKDYAGDRLNAVCRFSKEVRVKDDPQDPHHSQMLATFVTYEPEFEVGQPLIVRSRRFAFPDEAQASGGMPALVFKNPEAEGRNIAVNVWNGPFADLLDLMGGPEKHNWPRPSNDRSFRAYFNLCEKPGTKLGELPILTRDDRKPASYQEFAGTPDKNVACPTGRYPEKTL